MRLSVIARLRVSLGLGVRKLKVPETGSNPERRRGQTRYPTRFGEKQQTERLGS